MFNNGNVGHVSVGTQRIQKKVQNPLDLDLQGVVIHPM